MPKKLLFAVLFLGMISCQTEEKGDPFATVAPEETRFTKIALVEGLNEPMELEVLQNGDVLIIERNGLLKKYIRDSKELIEIGSLEVYPDGEDGLLGMAKDPNFEENQWLYLYYAPLKGASINRLSRFTVVEGLLDKSTEIVMLEVPVFRGCCHSGGSVEFDGEGNLYVSLGDDTTPFESDNYNPIDERPGRPENVDAQRSSGNSNDLRGSIIRITPQPDGTYTIPEGNLFPADDPLSRPEIYVKGNRNPYRIGIDQRNGNLFWGEVGPDASEDSLRRGPKGHDEINLATKAGYFGWPYFVGNNKPYWKYDFEKQESLFEFDPMAPKNTSPNNTGIEILPPATPALIWYPYGASEEFPMLGEGGRNAMAGPVYYRDDYADSEVRFPGYYDGKVFVYDWMRNWIFTVSLTENFEYDTMERFMPNTVFDKPVDMQFGPNGDLYLLEYGTFWRAQNDDSGLYVIEFAPGNRKPKAVADASVKKGAAPLKVDFSSVGSMDFDPEDQLQYEWTFGLAGANSAEANPSYTFEDPGEYTVELTVTDREGLESKANVVIQVGNQPPTVAINWEGNRSFYFGKDQIKYEVLVEDMEDGTVDPGKVDFSIDYLAGGFDLIQIGHLEEELSVGERYINESGCKACHAIANASVGPTYNDVSEKYAGQTDAKAYLTDKIKNGGGGVWGERVMPGHTHLADDQIETMVDFILALKDPNYGDERLPLKGEFPITEVDNVEGYYVVQAGYTDGGANGIAPIRTQSQFILRNATLPAVQGNEYKGAAKANTDVDQFVKFTEDKSWVRFAGIDLSSINQLKLLLNPGGTKGSIEIRIGSLDGKVIGKTKTLSQADRPSGASGNWFPEIIQIEKTDSVQDIYFIFEAASDVSIWNTFNLYSIQFSR
ncbi:PQQ-dependent sugar dehydrogenase [Algoriphagus namhaensis]|uniref:PQQ-dependent sugar dehydrogenase n=1 Tax=Algoriphagus namhaensis TaxID=915353 RepID=A0ABV8AUU6_9BACT